MFLQGQFWDLLKRGLVREGRSSRKEFLIYGALLLFTSLFVQLLVPFLPKVGSLGILVLASSIYLSRVMLAQAIRRCHDLGISGDYLKSFKHQVAAYAQAFLVLVFLNVFQSVTTNVLTAVVLAAGASAIIVMNMVGGPKVFRTLATTVGNFGMSSFGEAPEATMAAFGIYSAPKQRIDPRDANVAKPVARSQANRPSTPVQASSPRVRKVVKVEQSALPGAPKARVQRNPKPEQAHPHQTRPQQNSSVKVRKRPRGAIGEWGQDGR